MGSTMRAMVAMPDGKLENILNPEKLMSVQEIVETLSKICRWGGRCNQFYNVLQHSVEVASRLPNELKIQGLMHDFSEAWIWDIPHPLKKIPEIQFLVEVENKLQKRVWEQYGNFSELDPLVSEIDSRIAMDEAITFGLAGDWMKHGYPEPLHIKIKALTIDESLEQFWNFAEQYTPSLCMPEQNQKLI